MQQQYERKLLCPYFRIQFPIQYDLILFLLVVCSRVEAGSMPTLQQLGFNAAALAAPGAKKPLGADLKGGESEALRHLQVSLPKGCVQHIHILWVTVCST